MQSYIRTTESDRVMLVELTNPPHQFMNEPMIRELRELFAKADRDPGIGAVVITGSDPDRFLAHYDVEGIAEAAKSSPAVSESLARFTYSLVRVLRHLPGVENLLRRTPLGGVIQVLRFHDMFMDMGDSGTLYIAAINGQVGGGGMELALACDLRFISDQGEMAQPESVMGIIPGAGGTQRLCRLIGHAKALEIMLTGRRVYAEEAGQLGLVNRVFPHEKLVDEVMNIAKRLARLHPASIKGIKKSVNRGGSMSLPSGLKIEQAAFLHCIGFSTVQKSLSKYVSKTKSENVVPYWDSEMGDQFERVRCVDFDD